MGVSLEQLKGAMDGYGNIRFQVDALKSNLETVFDTVLARYPEARVDIEDAREELEIQIANAVQQEKEARKVLDSMIDNYLVENPVGKKDVIKSEMLTVSLTANTTYDPVALDGYALSNPAILGFRNEEVKRVVRLRPLGK